MKRTIQIDFKEKGTRDYGLEGFTGDFNNIIITDDYFYNYGLDVFDSKAKEFLVQVQKISRLNGDMAVTTTFINEEIYKEIKKKYPKTTSAKEAKVALIKSNGKQLYESRFQFFSKKDAQTACSRLKKYKRDCFIRG